MNLPGLISKYLIVAVLTMGSSSAFAGVFVSIGIAPPPLPIYAQPACPGDGYLWTPGYWAYGDYGYYWVPGAWVQPPEVGVFWTPCYWGWGGNSFAFHSGYWGPDVGFYGGINYGYGYGGYGYGGGRWEGGHFAYNEAVNNIGSANIHNRYVDRSVITHNTGNISYNGGKGGVQARPTAQEQQFSHERHIQPTSMQRAYASSASRDRGQLAKVNGGHPATLAAAKPESYKPLAQEHKAGQTVAQQAKLKNQPVTSAKNLTQVQKETHTASTMTHQKSNSPESRYTATAAVKSHEKTARTQSAHPYTFARSQSHPEMHAKPQSHPEVHAKPEVHSDKSQAH